MRRSVLPRTCAVIAAGALAFTMGVGYARAESLDGAQSDAVSTDEGVDADAADFAQPDAQSAMARTRSADERRSETVDAPANADSPAAPVESEDDQPPVVGSWVADAKGWRYEYSDGTAVRDQVMIIDGVAYAFNASGYVARGWYRDAEGPWYLSSDSGLLTGWQRVNGSWYFLADDGVMHTGWYAYGGTWYYLTASGVMATGWRFVDGDWFYLQSSGAMLAASWLANGGTWYYLRPNGTMATGWQIVGGHWYYFSEGGAMATGWVRDGAQWYHLASSGAMTQGWLQAGEWYYLDPAYGGAMATQWRMIGGQWHYFDRWDGFWVTGRASCDADWAYAKTLYSPTNYLITVDTRAPHCMSFYWRDGAWQPHHDWPCSVGKASTPTVKGSFSIGARGYSFGSGYTAYYWTQFWGDYLFHSILYHQGTFSVKDGTLGGHVSLGCVRMRIDDARWINQNVPSGTRVVVY